MTCRCSIPALLGNRNNFIYFGYLDCLADYDDISFDSNQSLAVILPFVFALSVTSCFIHTYCDPVGGNVLFSIKCYAVHQQTNYSFYIKFHNVIKNGNGSNVL